MHILLTGGTGFLGRHLRAALLKAGHRVTCTSRNRRPPVDLATPAQAVQWVQLDMARAHAVEDWLPHLRGVDCVINAVGLFRQHGEQSFEVLHVRAPIALFDACAAAGVPRIVQISALGADEHGLTPYHLSKKAADDHLLQLAEGERSMHAVVLQPSLVFGTDGASATMFAMLASLPVLLLPAGGRQRIQPVHVDDVVEVVLAMLALPLPAWPSGRLPIVGPSPINLADYLAALRSGMGLAPAPRWSVPARWIGWAARVGDRWPRSLLDSASWQMLQQGNTGDARPLTALLGRPPRGADEFIAPSQALPLRFIATWRWLAPMARLSVAVVWLWTAAVSFGLYPVRDSLQLLTEAGVPGAMRPLALYGAAALDLALGLLTLSPLRARPRRWLWRAQALLMVGYTAIISWKLPEYWLHPYGPILKNLPMLALLWVLHTFEHDGKDPGHHKDG